VLGHRRLRNPRLCRERRNRLFSAPAQPFEDRPPGRVRQRSENRIPQLCHRNQ